MVGFVFFCVSNSMTALKALFEWISRFLTWGSNLQDRNRNIITVLTENSKKYFPIK
jgi:hypothetical protein